MPPAGQGVCAALRSRARVRSCVRPPMRSAWPRAPMSFVVQMPNRLARYRCAGAVSVWPASGSPVSRFHRRLAPCLLPAAAAGQPGLGRSSGRECPVGSFFDEQRPGDPGHLVGQRHCRHLKGPAREQPASHCLLLTNAHTAVAPWRHGSAGCAASCSPASRFVRGAPYRRSNAHAMSDQARLRNASLKQSPVDLAPSPARHWP